MSDSLRFELRRLQLNNDLRLYEYDDAGRTAIKILTNLPSFIDSATVADIRNTGQLARTLRGVPPQTKTLEATSIIHTDSAKRIPVLIGKSLRHYSFDTGANLSVLMRSEAEGLGLRIRPAALTVGSSTGASVKADLAVAPIVRIGHVVLRNVVFLVLPDAALTFADGFRIPGLIGFPVIEDMGEVQFHRDGSLEIPVKASTRSLHNLALEELRPLVRIEYGREALVCLLDTGSGRTEFLAPYYELHRAQFSDGEAPDSLKTAGAGGARVLSVYRLRNVNLTVGGTSIVLDSVAVRTSYLQPEKDEPACTIGLDVLRSANEYIINFRSMTLELR